MFLKKSNFLIGEATFMFGYHDNQLETAYSTSRTQRTQCPFLTLEANSMFEKPLVSSENPSRELLE